MHQEEGQMGEIGYAKPVLVTTEWVSEHVDDPTVVIAEVDENPALYDEGHIRSSTCAARRSTPAS